MEHPDHEPFVVVCITQWGDSICLLPLRRDADDSWHNFLKSRTR